MKPLKELYLEHFAIDKNIYSAYIPQKCGGDFHLTPGQNE